jgi:hypothetical protein
MHLTKLITPDKISQFDGILQIHFRTRGGGPTEFEEKYEKVNKKKRKDVKQTGIKGGQRQSENSN